jgi:hypothetical protein
MEYNTHDNYGRPYKVIIHPGNNVQVYSCVNGENSGNSVTSENDEIDEMNSNNQSYEILLDRKVNTVFIGKSPVNEMTKFSGGSGKQFDGNSFLLELDTHTYQHIGRDIFTFNSYNKIVKYVSPVGNNDVPYPYAIDIDGNIYLLIEDIVLINTDQFKQLYTSEFDDPYSYYYGLDLITEDFGCVPPKIPKIKEIEEFEQYNKIKEFYHNDEKYTLRYTPHPEERFKDGDSMYIIYKDGEQKHLTKEDYVNLNEQFGLKIGFRKILNKEIQH